MIYQKKKSRDLCDIELIIKLTFHLSESVGMHGLRVSPYRDQQQIEASIIT